MTTPDRLRAQRFLPSGPGRGQRLAALVFVLLGLVLAFAWRPASDAGSAARDAEPLPPPTPGVRVALHLGETTPREGCVVWTAAFQASWDRMADMLHMPAGIDLAAPADPAAVRALNENRLARGVIPEGDLQVIADHSTPATWAAVDRASDLGPPAGVRDLDRRNFVAFARLRSSLRYAVPFFVLPRPLHFGSAGTAVRAYGLPRDNSGPMADRMRDQVDLHVPEGADPGDLARYAIVVLKARDGKRVVLSGRRPRATLAATWRDAKRVMESTPTGQFSVVDELAIPRVAIRAGRSYDEIAPAPIASTLGRLVLARQDVSLTVDERGADVDAEALLVAYLAMPRVVRYEGPFLLALLAPGSREPYVVAWIGSAAALTSYDAPIGHRPDAAEMRALEGTWTLDAKRSVEATLERWRRLAPRQEHADRGTRADLAGHFRTRRLRIVVRADATVSVETAQRGSHVRTVQGRIVRDGARLLLLHPSAPDPYAEEEDDGPGERRWRVTREAGRLVLHAEPAGGTLVLVR